MEHQAKTVNQRTNLVIHQPIFLIGAERSGTTLLRLMLSQHPQIAWCAEFEYAVDLLTEPGAFPSLSTYHEWLATHRIFTDCHYHIDRSLSYPELIHNFLQQERDRNQKTIVGATVHRHFDRLLWLWSSPKCQPKFIHIVRDPRDVACSCMSMGWAGNAWSGVSRWIEAEDLWQQLQRHLSPDQKFEITYESLVVQPEVVLAQLCQFMGVTYDAAMLRYPETTTYSAPNPDFVHQWQQRLSPWEIQLVEARVAARLTERGYKPSHFPGIQSSIQSKRWQFSLWLQDWLKRKQFRMQRYGLPLLVSDFLSRRLRLKGWQREIRLKLNEIERSYLK